jgi:hypothetical protein
VRNLVAVLLQIRFHHFVDMHSGFLQMVARRFSADVRAGDDKFFRRFLL